MKKLLKKFRPTKENIENLSSDKVEFRFLLYKILISLIGVLITLGFAFVSDADAVIQLLAIDQASSIKIWLISVGHLTILTAVSYVLFYFLLLCVLVGITKVILKFTDCDLTFKKLSNIYIFSDLIITALYWPIFYISIIFVFTFVYNLGPDNIDRIATTLRGFLKIISNVLFLFLFIYMITKIKRTPKKFD